MSVFAQKLSRLRCTYSTLLRLGKKRDYPQRLIALSGCKFSTLMSSSCTTDANDHNELVNAPEAMRENEYARNLFLSSHKYRKSVMQKNTAHAHVTNEQAMELLNQDWNQKTDFELLSATKKLNYNICYSDEKIDSHLYENIFVTLQDCHKKMNDNDLMILIQQLVPFRQFQQQYVFYQKFCHQLNLECVKRFMNLPTNNMLMLCDMLYEMTHTRDCEYIWHAVRKLGNKPHKLEPHQLVQVMFFLNVCRKPPINMYELEYHFQQCFDELSINEMGIVALGFFKTGTQIRNSNLLNLIMIKAIDNLNDMDNVSIGAIAKLIRYSMKLTLINTLKKFIDGIVPIEPRLTLMTLNHIAHASTRVALYHEEFINRMIKRLNNELTTARLKDLERFVFFFSSFNIDANNSVYNNVISELRTTWYTRRAHEIEKFPHVVSRLLGFLSYVNIYPTDLIERIMTPENIHKSCKGNYYLISREYFALDYSLQVEVPQYKGHFLRPNVRNQMLKKHFFDFQSAESSRSNVFLIRVLQTCQEIFNNTSDIMVNRPLPHFTIPDIIFCLDEQNRLVPIKNHLSKFKEGEIKWMRKEDLKNNRLIALIMGHHGVLIKGTNLPIGLLAAKIRQLAKIGYTPIVISHIVWRKLETQEAKSDYVRQHLFQDNASELIMQ